ncbi:UDP-glucoronosyl and UDP-glucosyl transferase [Ancylostoma caninum]|uniref:UDP-glucuronosyltransferase n=1 Tax=Ancylostoma caninum TaxID=29170 RepID=A0A368GY46_ANCCA|nr:UDP-glucoronosyl and UDP-glucosyl transferase [Ancylostoma caninum]
MLVILLLSLLTVACNSYKILVISPKYGYSHMNFMGKIADTLVDAGHDVVTFQPIVNDQLVGTGTSKSRLIQTQPTQELKEEIEMFTRPESLRPVYTADPSNPMGFLAFVPSVKRVTAYSISGVLSEKKILQQLRDEKFDLAITELFEFIGLAVTEALGIKNVVGAHSNGCILEGTAQAIGLPLIPSYMPAANGVTDDSYDISTRATNLLFTVLSVYMQRTVAASAEQAMVEKLGSAVTPVWASSGTIWLEFPPYTNTKPLLDFPKPTLHSIVNLGGIGVAEAKPLSQEWENILSLRERAILISLGSVIPSVLMPEGMKKTIIEAVKSYPNITFIWKYEDPNDPLVSGVENLVLSKWTPQNDLLGDHRLSAFVTHGGSGSMMESAVHGKPLIVIPLFGDQTRNAKTVVKYGLGIHMEKSKLLTKNAFREAVDSILADQKYRIAAKRMQRMLERRLLSPQEKLVKTIRLAAEFGNMPEQRVAGRNLGFIVYYNIDIISILVLIIISVITMIWYVLLRLFQFLYTSTKVKTQ